MEDLIKRLRDGITVPLMEERHAVADALEAQQARIAELLGIVAEYHNFAYENQCHMDRACCSSEEGTPHEIGCAAHRALSRPDDLSALATHDAEVKKTALLEAAEKFEQGAERHQVGAWIGRCLRDMAEGEQK